MKSFIILLLLIISKNVSASDDIYGIKCIGIDSSEIKMSQFAGKKIIVVVFDATKPEIALLMSLDSIYRNSNGQLAVLGIPVNDMSLSSADNSQNLFTLLRDTFKISFPITLVSKGKKGLYQQPVIQWITSKSAKNHFNLALENTGEMFIISSNGVLYAAFENGLPADKKIIQHVLTNEAYE